MPISLYQLQPYWKEIFENAIHKQDNRSVRETPASAPQKAKKPLVYQAKRKVSDLERDSIDSGILLPSLDVFDTPDKYEVIANLAGVSPKDLNIDFDPVTYQLKVIGKITFSEHDDEYRRKYLKIGERKIGKKYEKDINFSQDVPILDDRISASLFHGVLKIKIPKKTEKNKTITIEITDDEDEQ